MKPPEEFIKWLQAHPAVWEALQKEWEPQVGDWVWEDKSLAKWLGVVIDPTDVSIGAWFHDIGIDNKEWYVQASELRWLPTLGQLVRMLEETECGFTLYSPDIEDDELEYKLTSYQVVDFDMDEKEPEIACTALWAKVKGINV